MDTRTTNHQKELLLRIVEGDEDAFKMLFFEFLPMLKPFVLKFIKSEFASEEIIQNLFIRVWLNREKLAEVESIRSWLFKYAANECLNYLRAEGRELRMLTNKTSNEANQPFQSYSPTDHLQVKEINELIAEAVSKMPLKRKEIYLLSRSEGLTIPEIAKKLGVSPNTVKNVLVTSLKYLRGYLEEHGYLYTLLFILFEKK